MTLTDDTLRFLDTALPSRHILRHVPGTDWPEIEIIYGQRVFFVRLLRHPGPDRPSGYHLRHSEKEVHNNLMDAGAFVSICHAVSEVENALAGWGIPLKVAA